MAAAIGHTQQNISCEKDYGPSLEERERPMIREHAAEEVMDPHKTSSLGLHKSPIFIVWVIGHTMTRMNKRLGHGYDMIRMSKYK